MVAVPTLSTGILGGKMEEELVFGAGGVAREREGSCASAGAAVERSAIVGHFEERWLVPSNVDPNLDSAPSLVATCKLEVVVRATTVSLADEWANEKVAMVRADVLVGGVSPAMAGDILGV